MRVSLQINLMKGLVRETFHSVVHSCQVCRTCDVASSCAPVNVVFYLVGLLPLSSYCAQASK